MNNTVNPYRRSNYFIEKKFQATFIMKFCFLVIAGGFLIINLVYFFASQASTVSIVNSRVVVRSASDFILPILVQTVAITVILVGIATILVTLLFSHRIAGPLYRFKKVLEALEAGDFSSAFKIRTLDQLQILADTLNSVVVKNRKQLGAIKDALDVLGRKLDDLVLESSQAQKNHILEAKAEFDRVKKKFEYYKI